MDTSVLFRPECSSCRAAARTLVAQDVEAEYIRDPDNAPTRAELELLDRPGPREAQT